MIIGCEAIAKPRQKWAINGPVLKINLLADETKLYITLPV